MRTFTREQANEMYAILVEISETLDAKKKNKTGHLKLSLYEKGWLNGINDLLKKMDNLVNQPT